jgi:prepilin-type N-terminal cleavage/methylation domain-containing protein
MSAAGSSGTGRPARDAGFTAVELLVALAAAALLVGLAVPLYSVIADAVRFRTTARAMVAELRHARGAAMRAGTPVILAFDPAGRSYGLAGTNAWVTLPADMVLRWTPGAFSPEGGALGFFADGSSTGGELWLAGPRHQVGIRVHPLTGHFATLAATAR